jgi:hypothetical protein
MPRDSARLFISGFRKEEQLDEKIKYNNLHDNVFADDVLPVYVGDTTKV